MTFLFYSTIVLFILVCLILIGLVLLQKGRGGGLSGAFGGGGGNTAFGAKTGDVLTWATATVFGIFVLLAIALNLLANHRQANALTGGQQQMTTTEEETAAAATSVETSTTKPAATQVVPAATAPTTQP